jgi:hypothetical protein
MYLVCYKINCDTSFRSLVEAQLKGGKGEIVPAKKKGSEGWTNWIWGASQSYFYGGSSASDDPQKRRQSLVS